MKVSVAGADGGRRGEEAGARLGRGAVVLPAGRGAAVRQTWIFIYRWIFGVGVAFVAVFKLPRRGGGRGATAREPGAHLPDVGIGREGTRLRGESSPLAPHTPNSKLGARQIGRNAIRRVT
jgi:hypothetical protein